MKRRYHSKTIYIKLNVIPQKHFKKLKLWHCTNIKIHLKLYRYPKQKGNEEMKEMITSDKKRRRKNLLSRQWSMCFKYGQHAKNNAVIISTQASTCTMYMSISVNGKKKRKFQTSRSKAPPYFVYNSASLWFTCCFHFTFSSCSRDASAVNCKQGTKLK